MDAMPVPDAARYPMPVKYLHTVYAKLAGLARFPQ
jgi:hypothetical protein